MGRKRTWKVALGCGALLAVFSAVALFAYSTFQDNLGTIQAPNPVIPRWNSLPVDWLMNSYRPKDNVNTSTCTIDVSSCIQNTLAAGFATWTSAKVGGQSLTDLTVNYSGTSSVTSPDANDCQNVIGFSDTNAGDFSTGTIAFTAVATVTRPAGTTGTFQYQCTGAPNGVCNLDDCIADADIEFNPSENFSTSTTPPANSYSLQSVATHEEGHMLGMDHSGIGHTVMFPFGDTTASGEPLALSTDDAIGISFLYPCLNPTSGAATCNANFSNSTGQISGTVSLNGTGTFAAHVVAIDATTGDVVLDGLTAPDGTYTLVGVPPGSYRILALPLAADVNSGVVVLDDFSGWDCGYGDASCSTVPQNPTNYTGRYYPSQ